MSDQLEAYRAALDAEWRTHRQLWLRADIGAENSARAFLMRLVAEGFAETRRAPRPKGAGGHVGSFQHEYRRKAA